MVLKRIRQWLPWIWLALCFVSFCAFLHFNIDDLLDSDMATEMELARHMIDIGKWFSPDWYYGNEIRVFSIQLFYIPFFFLFDNWHYIRLFGTITAVFCLLASFYYLCRQLKLQKWFPFIASMFLFPLSEIYFYIILTGAMYLPHAIRSFLVIGLLIHFCSTDSRKKAAWLMVLLALVSFFCGLGGLRMLLVLFFPVWLASALFHFIPGFSHNSIHSRRLLHGSTLAIALALVGYVINSKVLSALYTFRQYEVLVFSPFDWSDFLLAFNYWLEILGFAADGKLFSSAAIHVGLSLILAFVSVCAACCAFSRKNPMSLGMRLLILTHILGLLMLTGLVCITNMGLHIRYLLPSMILLPAVAAAVLASLKTQPWVQRSIIVFVALLVVVCGVDNYRDYASRKVNEELKGLAASLVNDGYTEGYSTFWQGSTLTELTDGAIEMRVWEPWKNIRDVCSVYDVLQLKSHSTTVPEGKVFIILSKFYNEHEEFDLAVWLDDKETYWDSKDYRVYTFQSYDELLDSVEQQYQKTFAEADWCFDPAETRALPLSPLYPGVYQVSVTGTGLSGIQLVCENESHTPVVNITERTAEKTTFSLETAELLHDVSFVLTNSSLDGAEVKSFELQKTSAL